MKRIKIEKELQYIEEIAKINQGKKPSYYLLTMGCQLNENDSEKISGMLERMGYIRTVEKEQADIVLFNTCCVRENAEEKLFGKIGEIKKQREEKGTILAIGGCMMQEKHIVAKIKQSYPYVDLIFGTHTLHKLPQDLYSIIKQRKPMEDIIDIDGDIIEGLPIKREDNRKASVTIMNGCNNFCSYCIVPYVRGRERSRHPKDIMEEIEALAKEGYKEITLLGQNVNSYLREEKWKEKNNEWNGIFSFATLLRKVNDVQGIERIRFLSPHPKDFTQDVIEAIRDCDKIGRLVHLPLQSGSTQILNKMNRKYTKQQYLDLVKSMQKAIPGIVFSTDIIVGFPGETEEDFEDTLEVIRKVKFEQVFMFLYSRRVGTLADKMENQIAEEVKHERFERLKTLVENQMQKRNQEYIGTKQKIFIEGISKNNDKMLTGRTDTNKVVVLEGEQNLIGKMVEVEIVSEHMWYLKGRENRNEITK